MLLTAIKEMRTGKGASVNAIFTYIRATYGYDLLKNRTHIRKTLAKLTSEGLVSQVKGRGLAGSFRLGKKYKETKKMSASASKFVRQKRGCDLTRNQTNNVFVWFFFNVLLLLLLDLQERREHAEENVSQTSQRQSGSGSAELPGGGRRPGTAQVRRRDTRGR